MCCVFSAWCLPCTATYPDYGPLALLVQVGVFVSLVSTKIPFKGAGKEYIGAASLGIRAFGAAQLLFRVFNGTLPSAYFALRERC